MAVLKFMWLNPVASAINTGGKDQYVFDTGDFWDPGVISSGYYANYMKVAYYGVIGFENRDDLVYFEASFAQGHQSGITQIQNAIGWTIPTGYGPNGAEIRPERATLTYNRVFYANGYYWDPIIIYCDTNWGTNENSTVTFDTTGVPNCPVSSVSMSPLIVNPANRILAPTLTTDSVLYQQLRTNFIWYIGASVYVERELPFYPAHYVHYSPSLEGGEQRYGEEYVEAYSFALLRNVTIRLGNTTIYNDFLYFLNNDVCVLNARSLPTIDGVQYTMRTSCDIAAGYNYMANTPTVNPTSGYIPYNGSGQPSVQIPNYDYVSVQTTQYVLMRPEHWWFHRPGDSYQFDLIKNASEYNCWYYYTYGTRTKVGEFTMRFILPGYVGVTDNTHPLSGSRHTFTTTWDYFSANDPTYDITTLDDNFYWYLYNWTSYDGFFLDSGPADSISYDDLIWMGDVMYGWMYTNVVLQKTLTEMPVDDFDEAYYQFSGNHLSSEAIFQIEEFIPTQIFNDIDDLRNTGYDLYSFNGTPLYEAIDRGEYKIVTGKNIVRLRQVTKVDNAQLFTVFLQLRNRIMKIDVSKYLDRDIILDLDMLKPNLFGDNIFLLYVEFKNPDTGETTQTLELTFNINFWHYNHLLLKPGTFGPNGLVIDKYLTADNCDEYKLPYIH